jgi:SAM-dependent methyltransferase
MKRPGPPAAEAYFRDSEYWRAWSAVPDTTADIPYALAALRPFHRSILDAPCGRGRLLKSIARLHPHARLTAVDVSVDMVQQARPLVAGRAIVASVYDLPFRARTFDLVMCHQSFMHFDEPRRALAELTRVSRFDVYLSVTTRRQLNTVLRNVRLLPTSDVPHWTYNAEDLEAMLPTDFTWRVTGAFLFGQKALRLSHAQYLAVHRAVGRRIPQWLARRYGQTLFAYGHRREGT